MIVTCKIKVQSLKNKNVFCFSFLSFASPLLFFVISYVNIYRKTNTIFSSKILMFSFCVYENQFLISIYSEAK